MKARIAAILMTVALLAAAFGAEPVRAEQAIVFRPSETRVESGRAIEVPVLVENNSGFASLTLKLSYDKTLLQPVSVTKGGLLSGKQGGQLIANLAFSDHEIKVVFASSTDVTEDGAVILVAFEPLTDAAFTAEIGLDVLFLDDMDYSSPSFAQRSGTVTVVEAPLLECAFSQGSGECAAVWTSRTENTLEHCVLILAAYDPNGRMTALTMLRHTFASYESISLPVPAEYTAGSGTVRLFSLTAEHRPVSRCAIYDGR